MNSEIVVLAAIPIASAVLLALFLPRLSRFLGPAVIVASVVAAVIVMNRSDLGRDAWGPALGLIGLFIGAVGCISGLILIVGSAGTRSTRTEQSSTHAPYSKENPYRMPGPGLLTPKRLFVFIVGTTLVLGLVAWVYYWVV